MTDTTTSEHASSAEGGMASTTLPAARGHSVQPIEAQLTEANSCAHDMPYAEDVSLVAMAATLSQGGSGDGGNLEIIRLDGNESDAILFTDQGPNVTLHYARATELKCYVRCNAQKPGDPCVLCQIGLARDRRHLLPVYSPTARAVVVLPVSPAMSPRSLLPQLVPLLERRLPVLVFIRRDSFNFYVRSAPIPPGIDDGAAAIKAFFELRQAGRARIEDVYPRYSNDQLSRIEEIAAGLARRRSTAG